MTLKKLPILLFFQLLFTFHAFSQLNVNAYLLNAKNDIEKNNFSEAITKLNLCIQVQPGVSEMYFYRGICKYYLNDNLGADEDFSHAISIYCPFIFDAYNFRSLAKYRLGDYDGAISDINKVIGKQSNNPQLYAERAFCKLASQNFNGALNDCNKALSMQAMSEDLYICKGVAETALNKFDNALEDYNTALKINPRNAEIYVRKGITEKQMGNHKEAIENYNHALTIDSSSAFAYYNRAEAKIAISDPNGALSDYNTVLKYEPMNSLAYFNRAILESNLKNYKNAIADFDKVLSLNPENIQALFNRAKLKQNTNDYQGALADYNKTISLFPYFVEAYYNRSEVKKSLKDISGAMQDYALGKKISETDFQTNSSQRKQDSITLSRLVSLNTDFNNTETTTGKTISVELAPIFYIALKDSNYKGQVYYSAEMQKINNTISNVLFLTNKEIKTKHSLNDSSSEILNEATKDHDKQMPIRLQKSIQKTNIQLFNDAVRDYDNIIAQNPNCAIAYFSRGINYCKEMQMINQFSTNQYILTNKISPKDQDQKNEKYKRALSDFNKTIQLEPSFSFAYFNRAYVKCQLQDFDGAVKDFDYAILTNHDLADAYYNKGVLLFYLKDKLNACQNFSKAGELGLTESYNIIKKYCQQF